MDATKLTETMKYALRTLRACAREGRDGRHGSRKTDDCREPTGWALHKRGLVTLVGAKGIRLTELGAKVAADLQ